MNLAARIDHTILTPEATSAQVQRVIAEAQKLGCASVCVNGVFTAEVARALAGSRVKTCTVVGFPLGASKPALKAAEAVAAVKDGAQEIDFVAHLPTLLKRDLTGAKGEYAEVVRAVRAVAPSVTVKVILETALLMSGAESAEAEARIAMGCRAAIEAGCDFVKTSTGFHPTGGATVTAVKLLKKHAGPMYVKASGGIRNTEDALKMIDAGADRLGCSATVAIVEGLKNR